MNGPSQSGSLWLALAAFLIVALLMGTLQLARGQKRENSPSIRSVLAHPQTPPAAGHDSKTEEIKLSGPFTHKNLTIFLVHRPDTIKDLHLLTLAEALKEKKLLIHETKNVNELAVQNLSKDSEVFVQSGDIVKGGQQDRLLACDLVVPTDSGKMPIPSFCVESGRWSQRGHEDASQFDLSTGQAASKRLKLAGGNLGGGGGNLGMQGGAPAHQGGGSFGGGGGLGGLGGGGLGLGGLGLGGQNRVWDEVGQFQNGLEGQLGKKLRNRQSPSSLQLTVENEEVRKGVKPYIKALSSVTQDKKDVVGFAFAINGEINSADLYASNELFRKLWPRLLEAAAVEARLEFNEKQKLPSVAVSQVVSFLKNADAKKPIQLGATDRIRIVMTETDQCFYFQTLDRKRQDAPIHRNYLKKLPER
jgi:uncharacterized membrane protein YgcG